MFRVTTCWRFFPLAFALGLCVDALPGRAQQTLPGNQSPHPTTTITVNARLLVLDIVVTDKAGKPVEGLTRNDFQVYEDGKLQSIRSFEPPSAHVLPALSLADGAATTFDPASPASFGQSPVTILVLDQLNTHFADSSFARREIRSYLQRQPAVLSQPTELLVVAEGKFKQLSGFTRNRDTLEKQLDGSPTQYAWTLENNGRADHGPLERLDQSLRALQQISQNTARIPGRKNVIWVGGGFPSVDPSALSGRDYTEVKNTIRHVMDVLRDTHVTLYAVDPKTLLPGMTEITDASQMMFAQAVGDASTGLLDTFDSSEDFDRLAPMTGGKVVRGMNDVAAQVANAVDSAAQFYTLSYSPQSDPGNEYRRIKVVCLRPDVTVTTREGYFNQRDEVESSPAAISYDLSTAAESSVPLTALRVRVEQALGESNSYTVRLGASSLTWTPRDDGSSEAHIEVLAASMSAKGKMIAHVLHAATSVAKPGADLHREDEETRVDLQVEPAMKASVLRFVVRDAATGRMGTYDLSLSHSH